MERRDDRSFVPATSCEPWRYRGVPRGLPSHRGCEMVYVRTECGSFVKTHRARAVIRSTGQSVMQVRNTRIPLAAPQQIGSELRVIKCQFRQEPPLAGSRTLLAPLFVLWSIRSCGERNPRLPAAPAYQGRQSVRRVSEGSRDTEAWAASLCPDCIPTPQTTSLTRLFKQLGVSLKMVHSRHYDSPFRARGCIGGFPGRKSLLMFCPMR